MSKKWEFYEDQDDPCASCSYGNNGSCGSYKECDLYQNYHNIEDGEKNIVQQQLSEIKTSD